MSSFTSFIALFFVFACCMGTMANPTREKINAMETFADLQQQPAEQQVESFVEAPANQDAAPTDATGTAMSDSASSESSEETTGDTDTDTANGGTAATIINGGLPNPNVEAELVNNAAAPASGNQLPMKGRNLPSNQGVSMASSSSVSGAGIAVAVMAMVGFVVGIAVFVIKKYRHNFPVFVRV